ncbi:MAG TPA: hypothetical protein DIT09_05445 [Glutamicibacter sp.]|uniref:Uncharacterized protein n=1 Tax=Glutamicibacter arilaitensis TaxID=256701 RepID=A0A2N7S0A5_9MICC|nr:hypothetical protein CIK84_12885 [Glutamicibacter arilaitensis]HCJ53860.1 hypothetical protein [Glutamicibacter sp.]HCM94068.1 hypothetical protein [Glutamicibacter sp.]
MPWANCVDHGSAEVLFFLRNAPSKSSASLTKPAISGELPQKNECMQRDVACTHFLLSNTS